MIYIHPGPKFSDGFLQLLSVVIPKMLSSLHVSCTSIFVMKI